MARADFFFCWDFGAKRNEKNTVRAKRKAGAHQVVPCERDRSAQRVGPLVAALHVHKALFVHAPVPLPADESLWYAKMRSFPPPEKRYLKRKKKKKKEDSRCNER